MSEKKNISRRDFTTKLVGATLVLPLLEACSSGSNGPIPAKVPKADLISPKAGERFKAGSVLVVRWTSENITTLKLEYTDNDGSSWQLISGTIQAASGSYNWQLPQTLSDRYRVRLSHPTTSAVLSVSGLFSVVPEADPTASFVAPKGGETLIAGQKFIVQWTSQNAQSIDLLFTADGITWQPVASQIPASQNQIEWTIPSIESQSCRMRLQDSTTKTVLASTPNFTITAKVTATAKITRPTTGQVIKSGQNFEIGWTASNVINLGIDLSTDSGATWTSIVDSVAAASGRFSWAIPANLTSENARLRLVNKADSTVLDSVSFKISLTAPSATLSEPATGVVLAGGEKIDIQWTASDVANLKIEFSSNGGTTWQTISSSVAASAGKFSWTVQNLNSTQCKVRLLNASDNQELAISGNFRIRKAKAIDLAMHTELATVGALKTFASFFGSTSVAVQRTSSTEFLILDMTCTHAGCNTTWQSANNRFQCPCHGSNFNKDGTVINGPATTPLDSYEYKFKSSEDKVFVYEP